jgi:ribitol-5-phosphate 2-dehydrogenase (NADP+) / D-ribitol-5-phosphate cytidylyltransferase
MRTVAVVLAGGLGRRFAAAQPKQLRLLAGLNLIERCVQAFSVSPVIDDVLVVAAVEISVQVRQDLTGCRKLVDVIAGGVTRTDSTRQAIGWLSRRAELAPDCNVLFHDAARPLVDQQTIAACVTALQRWQAVGVVVPSSDTIVEVADGRIQRVLARDSLARCQTPQGFRLSVVRQAYELADADPDFVRTPVTDDCGVVLRYLPEVPVGVVTGSERNLKITYPADLVIAQALLEAAESE